MTMVRLDDLQALCGAVVIHERETQAERDRNDRLNIELGRTEERYQQAMRKLLAVREAVA